MMGKQDEARVKDYNIEFSITATPEAAKRLTEEIESWLEEMYGIKYHGGVVVKHPFEDEEVDFDKE